MDSYIPNHPFNDPGQAAKVGGNAPQVNISRGGPLGTQKLLDVGQPGLLRFHQAMAKKCRMAWNPRGPQPSHKAASALASSRAAAWSMGGLMNNKPHIARNWPLFSH